MTPPVVTAHAHDDVQVLTPSEADWTNFVRQELDELGIGLPELRQQALERDFQSTAARELWVMVGDDQGRPRVGDSKLRD
jgi:hypothetical protein